jgi:uncharacterized membrane protein YoaK (UPF0700 family)
MAASGTHGSGQGSHVAVPMSLRVVRGQEWRACTLAVVAGYADAYGFYHYQAYVSFMSGNTTQTGISLGQAAWVAAIPTAIAITGFVVGIFAGTLLATSQPVQSLRLRFGVVAAVLAGVLLGVGNGFVPANGVIAALSLAMGIMNTTLTQIGGEAIALGYVSGTLNALARHLALAVRRWPLPNAEGPWDTHLRRALILMGVWTAFLAGAALCIVATGRFGVWVLVAPVVVLATFAGMKEPAAGGR